MNNREYPDRAELAYYIPIQECRVGYLYRIRARNGNFGIYHIEPGDDQFRYSFDLSREKFGSNFIFPEHHWDCGPPFGTVKPISEICKVPDEILNGTERMKLDYLNSYEQRDEKLSRELRLRENWL